jgi:hypothetical protein
MSHRVALVRNVSVERIASIIRVTRIGEPGTRWRRHVPPKRRFLEEPHGITSQKTAFFIVTVVKTSNLTQFSDMSMICTGSRYSFVLIEGWKVMGHVCDKQKRNERQSAGNNGKCIFGCSKGGEGVDPQINGPGTG